MTGYLNLSSRSLGGRKDCTEPQCRATLNVSSRYRVSRRVAGKIEPFLWRHRDGRGEPQHDRQPSNSRADAARARRAGDDGALLPMPAHNLAPQRPLQALPGEAAAQTSQRKDQGMVWAMTQAAAVLAVAVICAEVGAQEPLIEVKGIQLGMTEDQVLAIVGSKTPRDLVIAGVPSYYAQDRNMPFDPGVQFLYDEQGHLSKFMFLFKSVGFTDVQAAFQQKYKAMRCLGSEVKTRAGGALNQVQCALKTDVGNLFLERFAGDSDTSALSMSSPDQLRKDTAERARRLGDI